MMALGHLVCALAHRDPAVIDLWVASLERAAEAPDANIIHLRLRPQRARAMEATQSAARWARQVRIHWLALIGAQRLRKRRRGD